MAFDHGGELFVRGKTLPAKLDLPVVEELSCPDFGVVSPELVEGFPQNVIGVQSLVGFQQKFQVSRHIQVGKGLNFTLKNYFY